MPKTKRNWKLYLQLDQATSKGNIKDDRLYLKNQVKENLGKHAYKEQGNKEGEYVAICKAHENCGHLVKIGPGNDDYFKIMVYGNHSEIPKIKAERGKRRSRNQSDHTNSSMRGDDSHNNDTGDANEDDKVVIE
jgi:hypothetical protein